jgi:putative DNA primase/helicase
VSSLSPVDLVLSRLEGVKKNGKGWNALCPAHEDHDPSLSVKEGDDGRVLLHCFAGCEGGAVMAAMGLTFADLFIGDPAPLAGESARRSRARKATPKAPPATVQESRIAEAGARVVCLADVAAQEVTWLWPGRIPLGKIALLIGDPGMAKTMLALDVAARVTTGRPFPDGSTPPPGDVVILTAEDGLADTIRPRLDRAGADVERVWALQAIRADEGERQFCLASDVERLEAVVNETEARLVMVDPLDAYLQGVDGHRNSEVRGVLAPLSAMLERTGAAGLLVHHLNKDASTVNALYRAGGSLAFVAAARSVIGVAPDPDNEGRRLLLSVKLNIAAKPEGIGYRVGDSGIVWDRDPVTADAATAFAAKPKRADSDKVGEAKEYILSVLADGRPVAQKIVEEAAEAAGITAWTLRKAKGQLAKTGQVRSKRDGFGAQGVWSWCLASECDPDPLRER